MMTEALEGMDREQAETMFVEIHDMLTGKRKLDALATDKLDKLVVLSGVCEFPVRVKCATLAWHTMHSALDEHGSVTTE